MMRKLYPVEIHTERREIVCMCIKSKQIQTTDNFLLFTFKAILVCIPYLKSMRFISHF